MSPVQKGPISQRNLLVELKDLIDTAMLPNSTAHRDIARAKLRALLDDPATNFRTAFIANGLSSKRNRYLSSIGYWMPLKYMYDVWHGKKSEVADD